MIEPCNHSAVRYVYKEGTPPFMLCSSCGKRLRCEADAAQVLAHPVTIRFSAPYTPIVPGTFTLRILDQLFMDDGAGGVRAADVPEIEPCGNLDYTTGKGELHLPDITCTYRYGFSPVEMNR